jgi:carbonic anhydrase
VLRNVANLVPPYAPDGEYHGTSAALEFAVQVLKVKHIVVMGHGRCGGVHVFRELYEGNAAEPLSPGDFIGKWISLLEPATLDIRCEDVASAADRQRALEEASVRQAIRNLATFPCVNILLEKGRIAIHGSWFDISTGELWLMDAKDGNFRPALATTK